MVVRRGPTRRTPPTPPTTPCDYELLKKDTRTQPADSDGAPVPQLSWGR